MGVALGMSIPGVDVAIVTGIVSVGAGGSDSVDKPVPVQALIRIKATKATKTGWKVVGRILL